MSFIDIIEQCVNATIEKHSEDKEKFITEALAEIINNNNFNFFTSDGGAREKMAIIGKEALIIELIYGALLSREIEIIKGIANIDTSPDVRIPINISQAQNHIYYKMAQETFPSVIYAEVRCSTILRDFLILDYAKLMTATTKEERKTAATILSRQFQHKLDGLEQFQNLLIQQNQKNMMEAQAQIKKGPGL